MLGRQRDPDRLHRKGDVAGLLRALAPHSSDTSSGFGEVVDIGAQRRARAAQLLADHDGDAIDAALRGALSDPAPSVRLAAIGALIERIGPTEADVIATAVALPEELREQAASRLATAARGPETAAVLLEAYVEEAAEPALAFPDDWAQRVARRLSPNARRDCVQRATYTLLLHPESRRAAQVQALDPRIAALATRESLAEPGLRLTALRRLGELRSAAVLEEIVALAEDEGADTDTRTAAIVALGRIKHPRAIEALLTATTDDEYRVRVAAMEAIDGFGTAGTVWGIATSARGLLIDPNKDTRAASARVFSRPSSALAGGPRALTDPELAETDSPSEDAPVEDPGVAGELVSNQRARFRRR